MEFSKFLKLLCELMTWMMEAMEANKGPIYECDYDRIRTNNMVWNNTFFELLNIEPLVLRFNVNLLTSNIACNICSSFMVCETCLKFLGWNLSTQCTSLVTNVWQAFATRFTKSQKSRWLGSKGVWLWNYEKTLWCRLWHKVKQGVMKDFSLSNGYKPCTL